MNDDRPTVPCGICGTQTQMTGTKRCDWCYELENRVRRNPDLARQILQSIENETAARKEDGKS